MLDYLRGELARRRARRGDDLVARMMAAQEADGTTSDDELLANLLLMFVAGHETTTHLIGNGMLTLLRHPAELARLRTRPALLAGALEEMMRFESSVNVVARIAHADTVIGEAPARRGDLLYCMVGAANRDPRVFAAPGRFDIARTPNPHLSFGGGVHYCLGAPLARLEGEIAFAALLDRFPKLHMACDTVRWRPLLNLRGLAELRLVAR
jgi:cytochrome P450